MLIIARKEILLHLRESRFPWIVGLFSGLILLSLLVSAADTRRREATSHAHETAERHRLDNLDLSGTPAQQVRRHTDGQGLYAFRTPIPLASLAAGVERLLPNRIHVSEDRSWPRQTTEGFYRNPLADLFPQLDFASIVATVLSLVGLFFTYDAFTGEKADGTLKLTLSSGVSRAQILAGKWAGSCLTLAVPFLLTTLAAVLLIQPGWLDDQKLARLAGSVGLALINLSLFVTAGLAISAFSRSPSASLLAALAVWVLSVFVGPPLLSSAGSFVEPTPTLQEVNMQKRAIDGDMWTEITRINSQLESKAISQETRDRRVESLQSEAEASRNRIVEAYERILDAQVEISRKLAALTPAGSYLVSASETAGTGLSNYKETLRSFRRYQTAFHHYTADLKERSSRDELGPDWFRVEALPLLQPYRPSIASSAEAVALEVILLMSLHAIVAALAWVGFLRFDVR